MSEVNLNNNDTAVNPQQNRVDQVNIAEVVYKVVRKWYYFAIAVVIALIVALFVNRYSAPKYEATTSLMIKANNEMLSNIDMLSFVSRSSGQEFQNSIGAIQSFTITKRVIKAMGLYCDYYERVNFRNTDIYRRSPFEVILDPHQETQPTGVIIKVQLVSDKECLISYSQKGGIPVYNYVDDRLMEDKTSVPERDNIKLAYDTWYEQDGMKFKIKLNDSWNSNMKRLDYRFVINDLDDLASRFNSTKIDLINKESSIVTIKFKHSNQRKAVDFVNMLCKIYIDQTFEEKNYLNVATIKFVDSQIASIGDSLHRAEARREVFQQANNTLNLTNDGQYLYTKSNELQVKRAEEYTRQQYYKYLSDYLQTSDITEGIASPSVMGVSDLNLNNLIDKLTNTIIEYKTAVDKRTEKNPKTKELVVTIETLRKQISESLANLKNVSNINMRELQRQQNSLQAQIDRLPSTERNMISIERQFKFNDEIYNFLYQKRSEAEIAKNAALPDHKVIDEALSAKKVSPKSLMNYIIAFLVGLLIPGLYMLFVSIFKTKIDSKDDIDKISNNPVFGYIPEFPKDYSKMIVFDKPRSQITEAYRTLRTNIKYVLNDIKVDGGNVILLTSSMPSEGKSINSFNIASVLSISGGKTLLVEFDLRKPRLAKMLDLNRSVGISTYFIGQTTLDESIQRTEFNNFDVLAVGSMPPNPSEIVDSPRIKDMLTELRKKYDYIILDTPPVNLIADAQTLAKLADISLYVIRLGMTISNILKSSLVEMEQRSGVKVYFIVNGITTVMQKYGYSKYGYGYMYGRKGYGYGYGYGVGDYLKEYSYGYFEDETEGLKRTKKRSDNKHSDKN